MIYDLCVAWNWEHDLPFLKLLARSCAARDVSLLEVTPHNLAELASRAGEIRFGTYLDRASESDDRFLAVVDLAHQIGADSINPYEAARRTWDKAQMHRAIFANIHTPYTLILPSYRECPDLPEVDLSPLGGCFTIKPANGGGGAGVIVAASSLAEVTLARTQFPDDQYLLQTRIVPARLGGRPAWFRVIYCAGRIYPCWWAQDSHVYTPLTCAEVSHYQLSRLRALTQAIADISQLRLLSTEIALAADGTLLVVDYVNDPIDLRLQSQTPEGVPDTIVQFIAEDLAGLASSRRAAERPA